ncbi:UL13 [anatid alphaherpesvirus 1]|nr:UL13 [Anatid alphaherpesvirus 1]UJO49918.1 UL13 [Anatid alphaherpesvirus 1]WKE35630.1 UL13 [Anatid alphaherpesvirus 1]WOC95005.1 UL13 [Anatid alphaherpesvirus 1]
MNPIGSSAKKQRSSSKPSTSVYAFAWVPDSTENSIEMRDCSESPNITSAGKRRCSGIRRLGGATVYSGEHNSKERKDPGKRKTKSRWSLASRFSLVSPPGGKPLTRAPRMPSYILQATRIENVFNVVFSINPSLHFTSVALPEQPSFLGSGGYGEVQLYKRNGIALKTSRQHFRGELLMTLLASESGLRAKSIIGEDRIITILGFSLPYKQMIFKAYDMDMTLYSHKLAKITPKARHWAALERAYIGLAKALTFLNISCGLTHLDVKSENIFINVVSGTDLVLLDAVLGDFSLMLLNANSTIMRSELEIQTGATNPTKIRIYRRNVQPIFCMVLGHAYAQPPEILLNALNGDGLTTPIEPINPEEGLAIDIYALGQSLIEVLINASLNPLNRLALVRNPTYFYFHHQVRRDFLLSSLAYRCIFFRRIFPTTDLTIQFGNPWNNYDDIRHKLRDLEYRGSFGAHYNRFNLTHGRLFDELVIPQSISQLLELAALFCHANPKARSAAPLLWIYN